MTTSTPAISSAIVIIVRVSGSSSTSRIGRGVSTAPKFMLFLLSAVLPLQNLQDLAHVGGKAVGQRRQRPADDIGRRQLQRGGECAEERIRSVGNPGGDLVPHLRPLLSPWPGRRPADAAFGFFFHNLSISAPELYLSRKVLRKGVPGL